jgi:peptidyl-prolyl cis-trans isomerase SurA
VAYATKRVLRTLCLAGVALAPLAAFAQDAGVPLQLLPEGVPGVTGIAPASPLLPAPVEAPPAEPVPLPTAQPAPAPGQAQPAPPDPAAAAPSQPAPANAARTPPANEQVNITAPKITTGVAAIVNDFVISEYDLEQRTNLFLATSGVRPTKETLPQIRAQVLRSLEDEVLELQEANKHKITVTKTDVDKALMNIADDNKLSVDQIVGTITKAGVTVETFRQQLAAQIVWQKVVAARYGTDIIIKDQQVDEALDRLKKGADKPQFLVSEVFVAVDRPEDEMTIQTSVQQIATQIKQGAPFSAVASQFSQSPSAADGGDIGWVVQGQLAEDLDEALGKLRPGQTAGPIRAEGGYYLLQLRDRREALGTKIEEPKSATASDPSAPLPLDRLLIPLPPTPDAMIKERAMAIANGIRSQVRSCEDLPVIAQQLQGTVYTRLGDTNPKDLNPELRDALAKTGPGEVVNPFFSAAGLEVIMRCDLAPPKLIAFELPTRDQMQQQLFVQQMSLLAKSYLRDLRRDAVVETR